MHDTTGTRSSRRVSTFTSLSFATVLCFATVLARFVWTGRASFFFLLWNLFLAWIPFLLSLWFYDSYRNRAPKIFLAILGLAWLVFYPNAPYIVTDFVHLRPREGAPYWFDLMMITSFAWTGLMLGCVSLYLMQSAIRHSIGKFASWLFVVVVSCLGALGICIGRFLRWNSWDIVTQPHDLIAGVWRGISEAGPGIVALSVFLTIFLVVAHLMISSLIGDRIEPKEHEI